MSILRLHSLYVVSVSTDVSWDNVGAATWCKFFSPLFLGIYDAMLPFSPRKHRANTPSAMVELNTGITCACLPMLKSFITRFSPRLLGSSRHASTRDPKTMGAYSRQTSKNPRTVPSQSHNSFYMADRVHNEIRGVSAGDMNGGGVYGNDIQVTTVVEVLHQDEEYLGVMGKGSGSSANTSELDLVLPVRKV